MEGKNNEILITDDDIVSWSEAKGEPREQMQSFVNERVQIWHDAWKDHSWQITVQKERELSAEDLSQRLDDIQRKKSDIILFFTTSLAEHYLTKDAIKSLHQTKELLADLAETAERQIKKLEGKPRPVPVIDFFSEYFVTKKSNHAKLVFRILGGKYRELKPMDHTAMLFILNEKGYLKEGALTNNFTQFHEAYIIQIGLQFDDQRLMENHCEAIRRVLKSKVKKSPFHKAYTKAILEFKELEKTVISNKK